MDDSRLLIHSDKITLGKTLGQGGLGVVRLGEYMGKKVAVKHLFRDASTLDSLLSELKLFRSLQPNKYVIGFYGATKNPANEQLSLVMEYAENGNLHDYMNITYVAWEIRAKWAADISIGLLQCHEKGVVHSDLKAENILLDSRLGIKISGFEISRTKSALGIEEETGGSCAWLAPERISKDPKMQEHYKLKPQLSDVYSFGLVVWEIAADGPTPYHKVDEKDIIAAKSVGNIDDLMKKLEDTPQKFKKVIEGCCAFDPEKRVGLEVVVSTLKDLIPQDDGGNGEEKDATFDETYLPSDNIQQLTSTIRYLDISDLTADDSDSDIPTAQLVEDSRTTKPAISQDSSVSPRPSGQK